jgi:hypothetical protein
MPRRRRADSHGRAMSHDSLATMKAALERFDQADEREDKA